jgi:hypothetical protein
MRETKIELWNNKKLIKVIIRRLFYMHSIYAKVMILHSFPDRNLSLYQQMILCTFRSISTSLYINDNIAYPSNNINSFTSDI